MVKGFVATTLLPDLDLWHTGDEQRALFSFDLEVTARCNNDCRHCYINLPAGDLQAMKNELSLAEIGSIADQAVEMGALWCLVTGGEPLLRKDFTELYVLLKRKGLLISVFTNACLVNEEHVRLFQRYPPRDVEVSVYGVTQETYERVTRKPGSYGAFRRGLDLLIQGGVRVRLKAMVMRSNLHELPEISRFCRAMTKDYYRFDPLLHLRYDGNARRNDEIKAERLPAEQIVAVEQADAQRAGAMQRDCERLISPEMEHNACNHLFHCGAGKNSFSVGYDGTYKVCSSLTQPDCVFDLRQGSLADAWNRFAPRVRDMRSDNPDYHTHCLRCPRVNLCLWCPANAFLECGRMDGRSEYFCQVAEARAQSIQTQSGPEPKGNLSPAESNID